MIFSSSKLVISFRIMQETRPVDVSSRCKPGVISRQQRSVILPFCLVNEPRNLQPFCYHIVFLRMHEVENTSYREITCKAEDDTSFAPMELDVPYYLCLVILHPVKGHVHRLYPVISFLCHVSKITKPCRLFIFTKDS